MSIAEDEAEKAYPTRYWGETHVKKQFYCDTDDLQEAYLLGRNAPPADAEIEAGAKAFYEALKPDSYPQWDSDCALRAEYYDAMRLAVKAMQGKAAEDAV